MSSTEKEFVLKHVFKDVSNMKAGDKKYSNIEEHFGVTWKIWAQRNKDHLRLYLYCKKEKTGKEWSIETSFEIKICSVNGKTHSERSDHSLYTNKPHSWGCDFVKWDEMLKDYAINDILNVEAHVKIKKMTGIKLRNLRNFDESNKPFSDVVLVVEDQKFHVSRLFLAGQSSYFNALLRGNSKDSRKKQFTLTGIDGEDFQNFLEILHSEPSIDDGTVTGILHLADKFDAKTVSRQCEEFLMKDSEKSMKEKFESAIKYDLENLKTKCLLEIKTIDDIRSVLPGDLIQLDHTIMTSLFLKSLSYQT